VPGFVGKSKFVVAAYDAAGDELRRMDVWADDDADAVRLAEQQDAHAADEYQAVLRVLSNEEIIADCWHQLTFPDVCGSCGSIGTFYRNNIADDAQYPQTMCLPCLRGSLDHGRMHIPESFEEELLPICGYCVTVGHLASDCPERPDED
jgi:hypothetical protein